MPGDIKVPSPVLFYPSQPVQLQSRWLVRMVAEGEAWIAYFGEPWPMDMHVWAVSSSDAVARAKADFFGSWATPADRQAVTLRVTEVLQEAV